MSERISSDPSRRICSRPEDDRAEEAQVANTAKTADMPLAAPTCRDRRVSVAPPDWDAIPNACDANAAAAARNMSEEGGGMSGGTSPNLPMSSMGNVQDDDVSRAPAATPSSPSPSRAAKPTGASTNAARTGERTLEDGPYLAAGRTHDGKSTFVAAAGIKGRASNGVELEMMSVSIQSGAQTETQASTLRLGYAGEKISASGEALTLNVHHGVDNSDGSKGMNGGATATLASAEVTLNGSGSSVTVGFSAGLGGEGHIGTRDIDDDGKPELCFRAALEFVIGGGCMESPLVIRP